MYIPLEFQTHWVVYWTLMGAVFGSFANALSWRLPNNISIAEGRSVCPACGAQLRWYHNIPILSYLFLRGRCGHCGSRIPIRYLWVELIMAGGFYLCVWAFVDPIPTLWASLFVFLLVTLSTIDLEHMILPDVLTLPGAAIFFLLSLHPEVPIVWQESLGAGLGAFFVLWGVRVTFKFLRGIDGLGFGDVKLMLLIGAATGVYGVLLSMILGSMLGLVIGGGSILLQGGNAQTRFPFGPFLAAGALAALWFSPWLVPFLFPAAVP